MRPASQNYYYGLDFGIVDDYQSSFHIHRGR